MKKLYEVVLIIIILFGSAIVLTHFTTGSNFKYFLLLVVTAWATWEYYKIEKKKGNLK